MNDTIDYEDALERVEADKYFRIVGNFLVRYGDPDDEFTAIVYLIKGCNYNIHAVGAHLKERFPTTSSVEVHDGDFLDENYIDIDWSEMEFNWTNHDEEFEKRVISTLKMLSN